MLKVFSSSINHENSLELEHRQLLEGGALEYLLKLIQSGRNPHISYSADIISMICTSSISIFYIIFQCELVRLPLLDRSWWNGLKTLMNSESTYLVHSAVVTTQMITLGPSIFLISCC